MSQSLLSSLHVDSLPVAEIGYAANFLSRAIELGVAVAPTAIIPISTLNEIAEHNKLGEKIEQYRTHLNYTDPHQRQVARESLARDIRQQEIPEHVSSHLTQIYHTQLHGEYIRLSASFTATEELQPIVHHNVKGDANLGESLLSVWAEAITVASESQLSLFPAALILQAAPQSTVSGTLITAHPDTGNKTRLYLESAWGVYAPSVEADVFEIDYRTRSVVHSQIGRQKTYWERTLDNLQEHPLPMTKKNMPTLTHAQLTQLTDWAITLKQHSLQQLQLEWQLVNNQLQLISLTPITLSAREQTDNQEILIVGDSLIGGYIQGRCSVSPSQTSQFTTGQILVTETLTKSHQGLIRQASAIVTERPITDSLLLQLINYYHIPTIVNATHATRRLQSEAEVMVDASSGKVLRLKVESDLPHTTLKLTSMSNNPYSKLENNSDAYYFKSDFSFLMDNLSPTEIVATHHSTGLKQALVTHLIAMSTKPTWYRLSTIHQGQLAAQNKDIEADEPNPYYGTRGAIAHLQDRSILYFELGVIKEFMQKTGQKLNLVLPFVRTPGERELLLHLITSRLGENISQISFWLELVNPDSVINLDHYLTDRIKGVIVPLDALHASWLGLDPENPQLLKQYPMSSDFIEQILTYVTAVTPACMIEMKQPHSAQLELLIEHGSTNLITKQTHVASIKKQIAVLEERQILHGSH